jgi:hypothetical protein
MAKGFLAGIQKSNLQSITSRFVLTWGACDKVLAWGGSILAVELKAGDG